MPRRHHRSPSDADERCDNTLDRGSHAVAIQPKTGLAVANVSADLNDGSGVLVGTFSRINRTTSNRERRLRNSGGAARALRTVSADQASRTAVTIATTAADNAPITTAPRTTAAAVTVN